GCRSTRRTACIARRATSRIPGRTSCGSRPKAAAGRTTRTCNSASGELKIRRVAARRPRLARSLQLVGMNEERQDFAAKLALMEREAKLVLDDLPPGLMRDRLKHIITLTALLRERIEPAKTKSR